MQILEIKMNMKLTKLIIIYKSLMLCQVNKFTCKKIRFLTCLLVLIENMFIFIIINTLTQPKSYIEQTCL